MSKPHALDVWAAPDRAGALAAAEASHGIDGSKLTGGAMLYTASGPTNAVSGNSWVILMGMDLRF